jgi:hypothetical protein
MSRLPVSQIASFNLFPPSVTYLTLKSTPALCSKESMQINKRGKVYFTPIFGWWGVGAIKQHHEPHTNHHIS